ncbi:hypothetical protein [Bacillus sp. 1P02SD]|uniref:hypothetical protein n=1 Tax=Bacillus sp. 1P02SD TaxID=3132264 RepID=UPI0039A12C01
MGYNTNRLLRDAEGYPIPQVYDPKTDSFKPATKTQDVSDSNVLNELKKLNESNGIALQAYDKSVDALGKSQAAETNSVAALETANDAKTIASTVKEEFDQVVSEAGESNPEIVQARGGEVNLGARLNKINEQLKESEQQTITLKHGLNVINSDQASPLKVDFYGNTLVNLLGEDGGFETDSNGDGVADGWVLSAGQANNISVVTNKQRLTFNGTHLWHSIKKTVKLESGLYYLAVVDSTFSTTGDDTRGLSIIVSKKSDNSTVSFNTKGSSKLSILKFTVPSSGDYDISLQTSTAFAASGYVDMNNARLYPISKNSYDKIGVSLTDADIEKMFPYVDSVQHVKNPVVTVEGANLLPPFNEWNLHGNAKVISPYELELNSTGLTQSSDVFIPVLPNTTYSFAKGKVSINGEYVLSPRGRDKQSLGYSAYPNGVFTTQNDVYFVQIYVRNGNATTTGKFTFSQPMFNIGSTPKPFVPRNPSYLYAETTLAGNADKKDILSFNESVGRWEKRKAWETDKVLDGSLGWLFHQDYGDYIAVKALSLLPDAKSVITEGEGGILVGNAKFYRLGVTTSGADRFQITTSKDLYINLLQADTGWLDGMTLTSGLIKSYFNGWKYTGDGTNHSWESLVDGSAPSANTLAYVGANKAPNFTPYKLTYQLANPVIEPVTVEGDLSIQGNAQVEVGSGVIVREKVTPSKHPTSEDRYININGHPSIANSNLSKKTSKIIAIYKNGEQDASWVILKDSYSYGNERGYTKSFDPAAEYTVTYEVLEKQAMTTNLNEVKATYQNSLKSSFNQVVVKQGDIATDQSILKRQMLDVLVRLEAGGM